jgi:hypothetical protein
MDFVIPNYPASLFRNLQANHGVFPDHYALPNSLLDRTLCLLEHVRFDVRFSCNVDRLCLASCGSANAAEFWHCM